MCLVQNLDWDAALLEELGRAFSLVVKLPKSTKSKIFHRRICGSDFSPLPRQLSANDLTYYNCEQKVKGKALVQMHTNFAPVLEVLFHTALDVFCIPDVELSAKELLEECCIPPKISAPCCSSTSASTSSNLMVNFL